jgi:hypothetical protein
VTKKHITGADVLRALADGRKLKMEDDPVRGGRLISVEAGYSTAFFYQHKFEIVEEPATDAELVAEMRQLADNTHNHLVAAALRHCADMLEKRSIKP